MSLAKDIRTVTEMKTRAKQLLDQVNEERRPVIITQDGRPRAVMMDVQSYEGMRNALGLMTLVAQGEEDFRKGRVLAHEEVVRRLEKRFGPRGKHGRAKA